MIVHRNTFHVKPGKEEEVLGLLRKSYGMNPAPHGSRVYTSSIGLFYRVVLDLEFENLAEMEAHWDKWWSLLETPAFMERWQELMESAGGSDVWNVVE